MISTVVIRGMVDVEPEELQKYIKGEENNLRLKPYEERFVENHYFICDLFCRMGYGQNANSKTRTGYLELYDFLKEYEKRKRNTQLKRQVDRLICELSYPVVTEFGHEIKTDNDKWYPSQRWHYLISYVKWKQLEGKKIGRSFACAELLLFLNEVINNIESIQIILNTFITSITSRKQFVEINNGLSNKSYILILDKNTYEIKIQNMVERN